VKWRQENDPHKDLKYRAVAKSIPPGKNPFRAALDAEFTDTAWAGLRARHWVTELAKSSQPFFLHVSFWKPHSPYEVAVPYDAMYDDVQIPIPELASRDAAMNLPPPLRTLALRDQGSNLSRERMQWAYRSYYGTITHVDHEIGLLLDALQASGADSSTIIVFSSDHGDQLFEHGITGKNCFFEPSVRVPFMVSLPGRITSAQYDHLIETVDLLPTLFELIGLPEPREVQGRSFAPLIADTAGTYEAHDAVFSENIIPEVITGGKLDMPFEKGKGVAGTRHPDAKMVRTSRWKYCYYPDGYAELYDVQADPREQTNLAGRTEVRHVEFDLRTRLLNWLINSSEVDQIADRWVIPEKSK
jgi:arylsulfatase A-like enzyme